MKADAANHWCWICGGWIDITLPWNSPGEFTVDHRVHLTDGGAPLDPANLAPAHRVCNQRRQPRPGEVPCLEVIPT